jgi:uncharacterized protein (UPF0297 family)
MTAADLSGIIVPINTTRGMALSAAPRLIPAQNSARQIITAKNFVLII